MKVLHLISARYVFGAERIVLSLVKRLSLLGISSYLGIIDSFNEENSVLKQARSSGLEVMPLVSKSAFDFSCVNEVRGFALKNDITIIHSHNYKSNFIAMLSSPSGCKWVVTEHTWAAKDIKSFVYEGIDKRIILLADKVVGVSENLLDDFRRAFLPKKKQALIYNGIDLENISPFNCEEKSSVTLGFIGRFSREKNVLFLVDVFERLRKQVSFPVYLKIAGKGALEPAIRSEISKKGLWDFVDFRGFVLPEDVSNFYASVDGICLCSEKEGLPMVVLEALAYGRPVIGSFQAVRALRDKNTAVARQCDIKNLNIAADQFGSFVRDIYENGQELSIHCRQLAEAYFSGKVMAENYASLYREIAL